MRYEHLDKIKQIDMSKLKKTPWLFDVVKYYLPDDGTVDMSIIPVDIAARLDWWLAPNYKQPPKPASAPSEPSEPERFKEETRKIIEIESKRLRNERDAEAVLDHYEQQFGLLNNSHNQNAIVEFIQNSDKLKTAKGLFTPQTVYLAVDFLGPKGSNVPQWQPKIAAPPPAATPKPWKPGDPLPDNATVAQLHAASVEEVKEWKCRKQGKDRR